MNGKESVTKTGRRVVRDKLPDNSRITWVEHPETGDIDVTQVFEGADGDKVIVPHKRLKANGKNHMTFPVDKREDALARLSET